eukprot:Nitzschia sp. Nitz4//scaffold83_size84149//3361//3975//NITZ4_005160-RA/size84149-processed-gene-0.48-mRNA-1//-1//CDS//3329558905//7217//frame0
MTVDIEFLLARDLGLQADHATGLYKTAKRSLGMKGNLSDDDEQKAFLEAVRIYEQKPCDQQRRMKRASVLSLESKAISESTASISSDEGSAKEANPACDPKRRRPTSNLAHELELRFIDAKRLINEAKVSLGVSGYLDEEQEELVFLEALRIFESQPEEQASAMKQMNKELNAYKKRPDVVEVVAPQESQPKHHPRRLGFWGTR